MYRETDAVIFFGSATAAAAALVADMLLPRDCNPRSVGTWRPAQKLKPVLWRFDSPGRGGGRVNVFQSGMGVELRGGRP